MTYRFKRGTVLANGETVLENESIGEDFSILRLDQQRTALYIEEKNFADLHKICLPEGFLSSCFKEYKDGFYYASKPGYSIFACKQGPFAQNADEVFAMCSAIKNFASSNRGLAICDLVYIEEFNVILPFLDHDGQGMSTNKLVGSWLSEGLAVSASDIDKLVLTNQWLSEEEILKAVNDAGIEIKERKKSIADHIDTTKQKGCMPASENQFVLPGREKLSRYFNEQIVDFMKNVEKYEKMGIHSVPATLLYGKPGCGKTYAVEQLAKFLNLPCFEINSGSVASPFIHDTSKKIAEIFAKAIDAAPSILIIDEIESYVATRGIANSGTYHIEEVDEFLRNIPKAIDAKVIIFGMTNMIDLIDPAIIRKGRFDHIEEVGMPSKAEIVAILEHNLKPIPVAEDIDLNDIADRLIERPISDVAYVVRQGARIAVRNNLNRVCQEHLLEAVASLAPVKKVSDTKKIGF